MQMKAVLYQCIQTLIKHVAISFVFSSYKISSDKGIYNAASA